MSTATPCPCSPSRIYSACCGPLHAGAVAPTAEALMRSRYSAYAMGLYDYLLSTWHPSACPLREALEPALVIKWMRLDVLSHHQSDDNAAKVEFVARFKVGGRAQRLHEISRFVRDGGRWFYLDGEVRG